MQVVRLGSVYPANRICNLANGIWNPGSEMWNPGSVIWNSQSRITSQRLENSEQSEMVWNPGDAIGIVSFGCMFEITCLNTKETFQYDLPEVGNQPSGGAILDPRSGTRGQKFQILWMITLLPNVLPEKLLELALTAFCILHFKGVVLLFEMYVDRTATWRCYRPHARCYCSFIWFELIVSKMCW